MKFWRGIWQNHFFRSSASYGLIALFVSFLNYIFNFLVARQFDLHIYGEYTTALAYGAVLTVPVTVMNMVLVKKIGSYDQNKRSQYIKQIEKSFINYINKYSIHILIVVIFVATILYWQSHLNIVSVIFVLFFCFITLISTFYSSAFQAMKKFITNGMINAFSVVVKIILFLAVFWIGSQINYLYLITILSFLSCILLSRKYIYKNQQIYISTYNKSLGSLLKNILIRENTIVVAISTLGMVGILNIDLMLTKVFLDEASTGLYAGLMLMAKIVLFAATPLSVVAYSFFTGSDTQKSSQSVLWINMLLIIFGGLCALAIFIFWPDRLLSIMIGSKFISLVKLLPWAGVYGLIYSLNYAIWQYFIAKGAKIGLLPIGAMMVQFILIWLMHNSIQQILTINLFLSVGLLISFILGLGLEKQYRVSNAK